jgi:hypothetical protein
MALAVVAAFILATQALADSAIYPIPADEVAIAPVPTRGPEEAPYSLAASQPEPEQIEPNAPGTLDDIRAVNTPIELIDAMGKGIRHVVINSHLNFSNPTWGPIQPAALGIRLGSQVIRVCCSYL